jgi:hypothetical protein
MDRGEASVAFDEAVVTFHTLRAMGIEVVLDLTVGHIRSTSVVGDGRAQGGQRPRRG